MTLQLTSLKSGYAPKKHVVHGVDLEVSRGELVGLLGPNGSGKSTLIKTIAGIVPAHQGSITWNSEGDLLRLPRKEVAKIVAYVPQTISLTFGLDIREAVLLGRTPYFGARPRPEDWRHVDDAIRLLGLEELEGRAVTQLSGGQAQRVLIARALAQDTDVLLLDEPTSALDIKYQWQTLSTARRITRERGVAGIIAIHDLNQAARFCDRLVILHNGHVVSSGTAGEIYTPELIEQVYGIRVEITEHRGYAEIHPLVEDEESLLVGADSGQREEVR